MALLAPILSPRKSERRGEIEIEICVCMCIERGGGEGERERGRALVLYSALNVQNIPYLKCNRISERWMDEWMINTDVRVTRRESRRRNRCVDW